jgi:hypothetical protein
MFLRGQDVTAGGEEPLEQAGVDALLLAAREAYAGKHTLLPARRKLGPSRVARPSIIRAFTESLVAAGRRTTT